MMGRIFFFVLLGLAAYLVALGEAPASGHARAGRASAQAQAMVSCATCGLHLPRQEALAKDERYYCCEEHRRGAPPE
jgi:uncharacterized protein